MSLHQQITADAGADAAALEPIKPWDYLRLRREAARLTIAQAARPFWKNPAHQEDVERILEGFEQQGAIMDHWVAETINRAFPFDPLIYRQLAEDPAHLHPSLCRTCGWDEWTETNDLEGASNSWAEEGERCKRCEQLERRAAGPWQAMLPLDRAA
jgi:hypothetical protein